MNSQEPAKPKRKILIELEIDWEDYDDVCDELVVEDVFENWPGKTGVSYTILTPEEKQQNIAR